MIATPDIEQIIGADAVDPNNDRIGKVSQVYVDADTDQPTWASVRTGLFGMSESLVPLTNATWDREALHVGVEKSRVKDAPRVDPETEISPDEQERLYDYYGMGTSGGMGAGGAMHGRHVDDTALGGAGGVGAPDPATMSGTGAGAAGLSTAGMGHGAGSPSQYGDGPAGPRFDRGQSREADEPRAVQTDAGYGEVAGEPGGPDVRASGRTAGDGRGSGDFASTGTGLENDNPVAEEAAEGTGSGYGTSDVEDISGAFVGGGAGAGGGDTRAGMREAGAMHTSESAGMRQSGGSPRLRRYVVRQETVVVPVEEQDALRMQPGPSTDDSSTGMRMDDQDPRDPGLR